MPCYFCLTINTIIVLILCFYAKIYFYPCVVVGVGVLVVVGVGVGVSVPVFVGVGVTLHGPTRVSVAPLVHPGPHSVLAT
jgi:hypothetical protein